MQFFVIKNIEFKSVVNKENHDIGESTAEIQLH